MLFFNCWDDIVSSSKPGCTIIVGELNFSAASMALSRSFFVIWNFFVFPGLKPKCWCAQCIVIGFFASETASTKAFILKSLLIPQ